MDILETTPPNVDEVSHPHQETKVAVGTLAMLAAEQYGATPKELPLCFSLSNEDDALFGWSSFRDKA